MSAEMGHDLRGVTCVKTDARARTAEPSLLPPAPKGEGMPATPWKTLRTPQTNREYVVMLTHLPMRKPTKLPAFLGYVRKIRTQLDRADGLVGYSLLAKPLSA